MTVRKRIFWWNTGMMAGGILLLFLVGGLLFDSFRREYVYEDIENEQIAEYTVEVYGVLGQVRGENDWAALAEKLSAYGFRLYVSDACNREVFRNLTESEWSCVEELDEQEWEGERPVIYSMDHITIVRASDGTGDSHFHIYAAAMPEGVRFFGMKREIFETFLKLAVPILVLTAVLLLLISRLVAGKMTKKVLSPVEKLTEAARRVEEGRLDEPIAYQTADEFKELCDTFDLMQSRLSEDREKAAEYERARTEMVAGISHDLRTPLTAVKGYIKGMKDKIADTPEKREQYLEIAYRKACDMEILLNRLFFFSRMETGNLPFYKEEVCLKDWLLQYCEEKKTDFQGRICFFCEEEGQMVRLDETQMKRVLDNLFDNSIKYAGRATGEELMEEQSRDSGKPESAKLVLSVRLWTEGGWEHLQVADNGKGVAEEKLPHIFERFYRGEEERGGGGSGLGLYICRYIIECHGGTITASSEGGLVFDILLPREEKTV
ncbi:MAG: HAMP domain-containing histidine kinase [Clostridiales bacterium]|nr:HAMP domain-containing histidine kinase [Clostridiales bacterium]